MNTSYRTLLLAFLFINFLSPTASGQKILPIVQDVNIEVNAFLAELQTKNYLFKINPLFERATLGFGGEILFGASFKNNWGIQLGGNYYAQDFKNNLPFDLIYSNPNNESISSSEYFISNLGNSFSSYDVSFRMKFDGSNCNNPGNPILDGEIIKMSFLRANFLEQIGIPFKVEKLIGKSRNKLYLSLGVTPTIIINDPKKLKYRTNGIKTEDHRLGCSSIDGYLRQIQITQVNLIYKKQNIKTNRVDVIFEVGLLHEISKNIFKISLFIEESISRYSEFENNIYQSQLAGIKFGIRKKVYKKKL